MRPALDAASRSRSLNFSTHSASRSASAIHAKCGKILCRYWVSQALRRRRSQNRRSSPPHRHGVRFKTTGDKRNSYVSIYDVVVIGEGVSGLGAAGMLAQAGLNVATIEGQ